MDGVFAERVQWRTAYEFSSKTTGQIENCNSQVAGLLNLMQGRENSGPYTGRFADKPMRGIFHPKCDGELAKNNRYMIFENFAVRKSSSYQCVRSSA